MRAQVTEADYLESLRFDQWSRPLLKQLTFLLLIAALIMLGLHTQRFVAGDGPIVSVVLFGFATIYLIGLLAARYWFFTPWRARRVYAQQKSLNEPFDVAVVDDGLRFDSGLGSGVLPWDYIYRWRESENLILIDHSDDMRNLIPKRTYESPEALEEFKTLLEEKVGPPNRSRSDSSVNESDEDEATSDP